MFSGVGRLGLRAVFGGVSWSPLLLFANGEQGAWYDPSDFSTMFQDSAGTTPVTAVEQPVGRILDKSGRGNHATQTTSTKRPVLSGRVNLLSYTDNITPTYWPDSFVSGGTRSNASLSVTSNEGYVYFTSQDFTAQAITYIASFDAVCDQTIANVPLRVTFGTIGAYALVSFTANQKTRVNINITTEAGVTGLNIGIDARNAIVPGGSDATGYVVTVSNPDLRPVGVGVGLPSYQRVSTSTDYDTAGFPIYLKFDGVDDYLLSGSINAGTNKGQILSGIRKILELTEIVAETGVGGDIGSFHVANLASASYQAYTIGSAAGGQTATSSVAAPSTNVVCNFSDISAPFVRLRVDGVQTAENTGTLGSGNFGNLPIYVGVRNVTTFPFSGNIYGLIVRFGANLDSDQTYNAENYLGQKSAVSIPAPSPSVFSPLSLFSSGAQGMWYDPSDFSTMFQDWQGTTPVTATGQPVGKILDKSGNNNHLYQGTAGSRPLLQQDGSGKYYLDFDGTNDYMFTGENSGGTLITRTVPFGTSNSQSVTVVAGARKSSDAAIRLILSSSPFDLNTNSFYLRAPGSTGVSNYAMRASGDVDFADAAATGYTAPITNVITGIATPSTNTVLLRVNGTQVASQTATTLGNGPFGDDVFYFGSLNTSQRFFIGRIYSTVVLGRLTTGTELSDTETWVNGKTGAY